MDTDKFQIDLDKCIEAFKEDLAQIRTGRATPELVEDILVDVYETLLPIKNYASINASDTRSLLISPWDKSILDNISKAISSANMGFSPVTEGDCIRVTIPELTEERRKDYVKIMKDRSEDARISVRGVRQKYMKELDTMQTGGFSEEEADRIRVGFEKLVKEYNEKIEEIKNAKEKDLMTI
ncbi:ribosome recycling factor [bacterium]|nr:ribosome recycling factor [bacterium]